MPQYKLYWVEAPSPEENCFIIAKSKRMAEKLEEDGSGFNPGDCKAILIKRVNNPEFSKLFNLNLEELDSNCAFYVQDEDLEWFAVKHFIEEGDDVFETEAGKFIRQGGMNWIASCFPKPHNIIVRSVRDLLEIIERDVPGTWIFRGQASCKWRLQAGIYRLAEKLCLNEAQTSDLEQRLLAEFRRRAPSFLTNAPTSDWDWLVLAQHFGLPTRLLDWTENPLVALYFAVRRPENVRDDGIVVALQRSVQADQATNPFTINDVSVFRPSHIDSRVLAQKSIFTAEPFRQPLDSSRTIDDPSDGESSDLRYWNVSAQCAEDVRIELARIGITESTLFPGLESLSRDIVADAIQSANVMLKSPEKETTP